MKIDEILSAYTRQIDDANHKLTTEGTKAMVEFVNQRNRAFMTAKLEIEHLIIEAKGTNETQPI